MLTDILTKVMYKPTFQRLRDKIVGDVMKYIQGDMLVSIAYCRQVYNSLL